MVARTLSPRAWAAALVALAAGCGGGGSGGGADAPHDAAVAADAASTRDGAQAPDAHAARDASPTPDARVAPDASAPLDGAAPDGAAPDGAAPDAAAPPDGAAPDADAAAREDAVPPPPDAAAPDARGAEDAAAPPPDARIPPPPDAAVVVCDPRPRVVINEIVASNRDGIQDEDGDTPDWIELFNAGDVPVPLRDWGLSDDDDEPFRFRLPNRTLAPGGHLLVLASGKDRPPEVGTWETRVDRGDVWRYLPVVERPDPAWATPGFDDGAWAEGPSGFGHGDGDDVTVVEGHTLFVRRTVEVTAEELAHLRLLVLHMDYDDGFVAYLNGVEVARSLVGVRGEPPRFPHFADFGHEAGLYRGLWPESFDLTAARALLVPGENVLAVELHDERRDGDDATLVPLLTFGFADVRAGAASPHLPLLEWLHADFELSAVGEALTLTQANGCEVDRVEFGPLGVDASYARTPDGGARFGYFAQPTAGAPNEGEWRVGDADVRLSPLPGYYPAGTFVTIDTATPGADVHYTLDGSEPDRDDPIADGPIVVEGDGVIVRARAFGDDYWPSPVVTGTYIAGEAPTLPTISVVTDPANLWDVDHGIYVPGDTHEANFPYFGANFWEDWERPAFVDFWEADLARGFSVDCGIKIHGGWSRANDQRSLRLILRSEYGTSALEYPLFEGNDVDRYKRLVLRNAGQDWAGCNGGARCGARGHLRDAVMHQIAAGLGVDVLGYRPVVAYLNGQFWGVYELRERHDRHYIETRYGHEDIDLLELNANPLEGDADHYQAMLQMLRDEDVTQPDVYARVQGMMDTDNFATYSILQIFYDNGDWPGNNIKFWRPRTPDGRWRWLLYDTDFGLGLRSPNPNADTLAFGLRPDGPGWPNPPWSTELLRTLMRNPTFRTDFINRYADLLNTVLRPEATRGVLDRTAAALRPEMPRQWQRWGAQGVAPAEQMAAWERVVAAIGDWLQNRPTHAIRHILTNFGLAGTWQLQLEAEPPGSGVFVLTAATVEAPFAGTYFRGVPVTITAVPAEGYQFAGWSLEGLPPDPTVVLMPDGDTALTATFE